MKRRTHLLLTIALLAGCLTVPAGAQDLAIFGDVIYPVSQPVIENGVVLIRDGKIAAVGTQGTVPIPENCPTMKAAVVTPGLIDAHSVVGLSGILNQDQDQDQLDHSESVQPQLRAVDAYNAHDELVTWVRNFGVTTVHTGHAPGELVSGQTMIVKTTGNSVEEALITPAKAVAVTLLSSAQKSGTGSPGTRGKMIAMLRENLIKARSYQQKLAEAGDESGQLERDLKLETLVGVLKGDLKLMISADRAQDIASALRLAEEFDLKIWIDSGAEAYLLIDEIRVAGAAVIIHPSMARAVADRENLSFETAAKLHDAGIPIAFQSGYEPYVPKTRVVLFEAALAAANGLGFDETLQVLTLDAARLLGIENRVGSLEVGKDADLALFDGDPFEYTNHCVGVVINGNVVSDTPQ